MKYKVVNSRINVTNEFVGKIGELVAKFKHCIWLDFDGDRRCFSYEEVVRLDAV